MIPESLRRKESHLRSAVVQRRFGEVQPQLEWFCAAADAEIKALPHKTPARREIIVYVREVLDWTGLMLSTARALTAAELKKVTTASRYLPSKAPDNRWLRLDI